jgi:TRAP-type C4-dicarboxylate transport system permease small subunit
MRRIVRGIVRACEATAVFLAAAIFAVMLAQVFYRYVLNSSLLWSEEAAVWAMVWMVMMGCVPLAHAGAHVSVPVAVRALPIDLRMPVIMLSKALSLVFLGILVWYGFMIFGATFHRTAPMLGLSTRWMKLAFPVGGAFMFIAIVDTLVDDFAAWRPKLVRVIRRA